MPAAAIFPSTPNGDL
ncbi:hypothetical protein A2U01_0116466, partial [Trifolium medium]|nr:hypothetical protein [Trifolium medium]